jgi:hypothetical protein
MYTDLIPPSISVRDLGMVIDSYLSVRSHVNKIAGTRYSVLRQLRRVRRSVPIDEFRLLVGSLVLSRLDYCNAALAGVSELSMNLFRRFQSVMNTTARTVADQQRFANISLSLAGLHWLRMPDRILQTHSSAVP